MDTTLPPIKPVGGVAVPCLVLEKNRVKFITANTTDIDNQPLVGKVLTIPCRQVDPDSTGDAWCYPIKDHGVFMGFEFIPKAWDYQTNNYSVNPPTYDSLTCFRLWDKITEDIEWYIYGSRTDFANSCYTCCPQQNAGYVTMPGVNLDGTRNFTWRVAPTVELGEAVDDDGNIVSYWGLPTLDAGYNYFPFGSYNNIPFPDASPTGYSSTSALLVWLNANAHSVGSPSTPLLTWTIVSNNSGGLLVATGGNSGDIIGLQVIPVPSS